MTATRLPASHCMQKHHNAPLPVGKTLLRSNARCAKHGKRRTPRTFSCSDQKSLRVPTSRTGRGTRSIRRVTEEDRTLSEAPRRHTQSWFDHYPRETRRRDRRHSLRSQDAPSARAGYTSKRILPAPGGVRIIIALAGERSLNYTPHRRRQTNGKEPRSAQTRTAPHIVAERTASHKEARLRHHGFSTSLRSTPRTPLNPLRAAPLAPLRSVRRRAFASHY